MGTSTLLVAPPLEEEQLIKELFTDHTAVPLEPCTPCIPGAPGGPYRGKQTVTILFTAISFHIPLILSLTRFTKCKLMTSWISY